MPYLNLDTGYFSHRKTIRLVELLGRGAEMLPLRLWCYCGIHHPEDGRFTDESPREIEQAAHWWGKTGVMVKAMVRVVFLERDEKGYFCHDWIEHEGHIVQFKKHSLWMNKVRWEKRHPPPLPPPVRSPGRSPGEPQQESHNQPILTNPTGGVAQLIKVAPVTHEANGSGRGILSPTERISKERELERVSKKLESLDHISAGELLPAAAKRYAEWKARRSVLLNELGCLV